MNISVMQKWCMMVIPWMTSIHIYRGELQWFRVWLTARGGSRQVWYSSTQSTFFFLKERSLYTIQMFYQVYISQFSMLSWRHTSPPASLIACAAQFLLVSYHRPMCNKCWHSDIEMVDKVGTSQTDRQLHIWLTAGCVFFFFQVEEALNEVDFQLRLDLHFTDVEQQYVLPPLLHVPLQILSFTL